MGQVNEGWKVAGVSKRWLAKNPHGAQNPSMSVMAFYEKVIKVKADVAAYLS
jgi:hypothetical protein